MTRRRRHAPEALIVITALLVVISLLSFVGASSSSSLPHSLPNVQDHSNDDNDMATVVRETIYVKTRSSPTTTGSLSAVTGEIHSTAGTITLSPSNKLASQAVAASQPAHILNTLKKILSLVRPMLSLLPLPFTHFAFPIIKFLVRQLVLRPCQIFNSIFVQPFKPLILWSLSAIVLGVGLGLVAALVGEGLGARVPGWEALSGSRDRYDERERRRKERAAVGQGAGSRGATGRRHAPLSEDEDDDSQDTKSFRSNLTPTGDPIDRWRRRTSDASLGLSRPGRQDTSAMARQSKSTARSARQALNLSNNGAGDAEGWMKGSSSGTRSLDTPSAGVAGSLSSAPANGDSSASAIMSSLSSKPSDALRYRTARPTPS